VSFACASNPLCRFALPLPVSGICRCTSVFCNEKMPVFKRSDFHHVKAAKLIADFIVLTALFVIVNLIRLCQSNKTLSTMKIM